MPRKNGFEYLLEIKLNKKLQPLLVIMFTTSFDQEVVNMLYQNGAQYFIRKPAVFSQFKKIIEQISYTYCARKYFAARQRKFCAHCAIVKKIVENHSGIIVATSELNKGATFDIYIPVT